MFKDFGLFVYLFIVIFLLLLRYGANYCTQQMCWRMCAVGRRKPVALQGHVTNRVLLDSIVCVRKHNQVFSHALQCDDVRLGRGLSCSVYFTINSFSQLVRALKKMLFPLIDFNLVHYIVHRKPKTGSLIFGCLYFFSSFIITVSEQQHSCHLKWEFPDSQCPNIVLTIIQ